ncbi:ATP-binding protein [Azohydromonas caseinilytica]|uniref:histidine kinase n=1 Tax=Azohydromonas caseinilytica TaxID=2728836 RepID=A0A848F6C9_9BURK|nr:ATP-binding protein [Azohydromonas caseinilytica]NML15647.1 GAF domain-containing protein [Azohydromonas caseinilytica]
MDALPPDLADCANEPIRVPGGIQPHGRMLVLAADDGHLVALSENWPEPPPLAAWSTWLPERLAALQPGEAPAPLGTVTLEDGRRHDLTGHRLAELVVLEFEPAIGALGLQAPVYALARRFLPRMQEAATVTELLAQATAELKRLTGFGRCLAYRFDDEGHGEVLAEALDPGYDSYLAHRFPAADIPAQARALYLLNQIRLIPDATYTPVPLRCVDPAWHPRRIDLSWAALRSVSPLHLEYMRNMGTLASMSVSIVVRGRLWGLISLHDHAPRQAPFETRVACEHLGRLVSLQIEAREDNAEVATRLELRQLTLEIVSHLAESDASLRQLAQDPVLLRLAHASGAAVVLDNECWTLGECPAPECIHELTKRMANHGRELFHSDRLAEVLPDLAATPGCGDAAAGMPPLPAAGVLAISISQVHRHWILWFRPEVVQTVQWAGNPRKAMPASDGRLHPRRSFESWREQLRGRSLPWSPSERAAVLELRQALIGIVLRRAEELAEFATELGRVNKELEAFSYTVSHDLRAPMRHIAGYVDLVLDGEGRQLGERSQRYLGHVKEAAVYAGRLVDALLDFSRMGRAALKRSEIDTGLMVAELVRELSHQLGERRVEWRMAPALPPLWGDPLLMQVVVRNLLSNALKYSRGRDPAVIEVRPIEARPDGAGLEVRDNGVGFQMKYVEKLFGVFQRLHPAEEFEGTGIGLANVRRIVERHGGNVWAQGEPGRGATFGFFLPSRAQEA